jgi:hypothetical protein
MRKFFVVLAAFLMLFAFISCEIESELPKGHVDSADSLIKALNDKSCDEIIFEKDIVIPAQTYIDSFSGTIDGNGYKLTIADPAMDVKYQSNSEYGLLQNFSGTIKNLEFHTNGFKALILSATDTELDTVKVYGEMNGADTNVAPFIVYACPGYISLKNCENHANIIDKMGGNHYGSAFVAYILNEESGSIAFENCKNYGTIHFGENAALFIGNPTRYNCRTVTVTDSYNYGTIQAFKSVGVKTWPDEKFSDVDEISNYNKEGGQIKTITNNITSLTVDKDGTPSVTSSTTSPNLRYLLQFNISYNYKDKEESAGNRNMTMEYELVEGKLPIAISKATKDHIHGSFADGTIYIDPFAYEYSEEKYDVASISELKYYVVEYDTNGLVIGSANCKITK